jgi:hypothetical protein
MAHFGKFVAINRNSNTESISHCQGGLLAELTENKVILKPSGLTSIPG